jgi:hypothetical protein
MSHKPLSAALGLAAAALLTLAAPAMARDRNHDRIPDRWERAHHLSLHVNQARRDQDRDGLRNRGEFKARTNPRDADSDNDGIEDGDENTGQVESFEDGVLTISLFNGDMIKGAVTDETEIECDDDPFDDRHGHDRGDDEDDGHHHGDHGDDDQDDDDQGDDDDAQAAHDHGDDDEGREDCGTEALVAGAKVLEAELEIENGEAVWEEVELLAPDGD